MRGQLDEYEKRGTERVGHSNDILAGKIGRMSTMLHLRERFMVEVCLVIVDSLITALNKQLNMARG